MAGVSVGDSQGGDIAFVLVQFLGQVSAGYVAGRLGHPHEAYHGALASLSLFAIVAVLSLAAGAEVGVAALAGGAVIALALGSAGGVLGALRHR